MNWIEDFIDTCIEKEVIIKCGNFYEVLAGEGYRLSDIKCLKAFLSNNSFIVEELSIVLNAKEEKLLKVSDVISLDKTMYELEERLKTDQEFSEQFYKELEEIKQIQIPLEDMETEELYKGEKRV